jgi:hypothetical protein
MSQGPPPSAAMAASGWLSLAATPTFVVMTLLSGPPSGPLGGLCAVQSPFDGMATMYALMAVFHAAPWLRLVARRDLDGLARTRLRRGFERIDQPRSGRLFRRFGRVVLDPVSHLVLR